jgi:spore coat protein A
MDGVLGDTILVNGAPWPVLEVSATKYRFCILNASNTRPYELALEPRNDAPFVQVGSDGGLLSAPILHRTIRIAQAERFDVVIDFSKYDVGTGITLKNRMGEGKTANVMRFRITRKENDDRTIRRQLSDMAEFEGLEESSARRTREFRFTRVGDKGLVMWGINGEPFDPERMAARPELGLLRSGTLGRPRLRTPYTCTSSTSRYSRVTAGTPRQRTPVGKTPWT